MCIFLAFARLFRIALQCIAFTYNKTFLKLSIADPHALLNIDNLILFQKVFRRDKTWCSEYHPRQPGLP